MYVYMYIYVYIYIYMYMLAGKFSHMVLIPGILFMPGSGYHVFIIYNRGLVNCGRAADRGHEVRRAPPSQEPGALDCLSC